VTLGRDGNLAAHRGYVRPEDEPREETVANFGDELDKEGQGADSDVSAHQLSAGMYAATVITSAGQPLSAGLPDDEDDGALSLCRSVWLWS
jgi:ParB family chromosome partitioning protein